MRVPTIDAILHATSAITMVGLKDILGTSRRKNAVVPRQVAMILSKEYTGKTLGQIAKAFNRDHTTIIHALSRAERHSALVSRVKNLLSYRDYVTQEYFMRQIKVYFASKRHHAELLKRYRVEGFHFNARWLDTANMSANAAKPASHWLEENFDDIMAADYVIVYAEEGELLKTALLEVGWAMAYGKPVIVVGQHESYRPWRADARRVTFAPSLEDAIKAIKARHAAKPRVLDVHGKEIT